MCLAEWPALLEHEEQGVHTILQPKPRARPALGQLHLWSKGRSGRAMGGSGAGMFTGTPVCSFISKCEFLNSQPISRDRARTLKVQEQSCVKTLCTQTGLSSYSFFLPMAKPLLMWPGLCHSFSHFCFSSTCLDLGRSFPFHMCLIESQPPSCPLCSFLFYLIVL